MFFNKAQMIRGVAVVSGGGGGGGPLAGMALWLKADAIATLADGDPVASWADSSGNGYDATQATSTRRPAYKTGILNGLPVVRFDNTDDQLNVPIYIPGAYTLFVVGSYTPGSNNGFCGSRPYLYSSAMNVYDGGFFGTSYSSVAGVPFLVSVVNTASSGSAAYVNGTLVGSGSLNGDFGTSGLGQNFGANDARAQGGDTAEVLAYAGALSDADRGSVESYLATKYAL